MTRPPTRTPRMRWRGRLTKLLVVLVCGAIINVAVAWYCELARNTTHRGYSIAKWRNDDSDNWAVMTRYRGRYEIWTHDAADTARTWRWMMEKSSPWESAKVSLHEFPSWSFPRSPDWEELQGRYRESMDRASGWPVVSMRYRIVGNEGSTETILSGGIRMTQVGTFGPFALGRHDALPLVPIWTGFAINAIFYAGIVWLLFEVPRVLRRKRRTARDLCPACAYPVGESDVCTECGAPVRRQGQMSTAG